VEERPTEQVEGERRFLAHDSAVAAGRTKPKRKRNEALMMKIHAIQTGTVAVTTGRRRDGRPSAWPRVDDGDNRGLNSSGEPTR
jgi:hypothetical protein